MESKEIWQTISYAWTEIGLSDDEYELHAKRIKSKYPEWSSVNKIIYRDVLGSFSLFQLLVFPLFLWMLMPDWMWDEKYIEEKMNKWYSKPVFIHYLNPLRIIGYPFAWAFSASVRAKLKNAFNNT